MADQIHRCGVAARVPEGRRSPATPSHHPIAGDVDGPDEGALTEFFQASPRTDYDALPPIPPDSAFHSVFAAGSRQNRSYRPGQYLFFLAHDWDTASLRNGVYRLELDVADAAGNRTTFAQRIVVANGD